MSMWLYLLLCQLGCFAAVVYMIVNDSPWWGALFVLMMCVTVENKKTTKEEE